MKIFKSNPLQILLLSAPLLISIPGCKPASIDKVSSSGKPYEIFVVVSDSKWNGPVGDAMRSILLEEMPILGSEPMFDLYHVAPENSESIVRDHRNIIRYNLSADYAATSITAEYDITAVPQLIVNINSSSDSSAIKYMNLNRAIIQEVFNQGELNDFVKNTRKHFDTVVRETIKEIFGIDLTIPPGFRICMADSDFLWISNEQPIATQGIFIYKYPFTSRYTFTQGYLTEKRNEFAALIPGLSPGSYMGTSEEFDPLFSSFRLYGRLWFELRGFWDTKNDFMGGPFVSYTTVMGKTNEVLTIDSYVFSPGHGKRNYIRQIENLLYMVEFPGDTVNTVKIRE